MAAFQDLMKYENVNKEELERLLFQFCRDGQKDVVDSLLSKGVCLDVRDKDGRTPLVLSSMSGHEDIVTLILDHGVDVRNEDGTMALVEACKNGDWKVVKTLVERGVDVNGRDKDGNTALMFACMNGHDEVVNLLIQHVSHLNEKNEDGTTPLMWACIKGHGKVVEILIKNTCDMNEKDDEGFTAFMWACMHGHDNVVKIMIKYLCDLDERGESGMTALLWACYYGRDKVVEVLIEHLSDLNDRDTEGRTGLMWACIFGHDKVLKLLIEHGARVNVSDEKGATPLIEACKYGYLKIVELLLELGLDVNASDSEGITPLIRVCQNVEDKNQDDCVKIIELLLEHGANIDARESVFGWSAATIAFRFYRVKLLPVLLPAEPRLDFVDRQGRTVLSHAMERESTDCLRFLLEGGKLLTEGRLNPVYKSSNIVCCTKESLLMTIEYGVFEWEWCPTRLLNPVSLAALNSGISPGKIKFYDYKSDSVLYLSPLIVSLMENETDLTEILLEHLYYYPEDYRTLCTDMDIRERIKDKDILDKITLQPLSLQTWCFVTVSKIISTSCFPVKRCERVDTLPIPDKFKTRLNFR